MEQNIPVLAEAEGPLPPSQGIHPFPWHSGNPTVTPALLSLPCSESPALGVLDLNKKSQDSSQSRAGIMYEVTLAGNKAPLLHHIL